MGHLHDHDIKQFNHLNGPIAYPGSIELTTSEGIKETKKGFFEVDISGTEAKSNWIEIDTRPQFSFKMIYDDLIKSVDEISEKLVNFERKPIVELKIHGEKIETEIIQAQISRLNSLSLRCFWSIINKEGIDSSVFLERPNMIDEELFRLSIDALGSEQLASFAVKELLPLLSSKQLKDATQIVIEDYKRFKKEKQK
jgi:DNA repair exonuclease SbcCD nuclease subunit